MGEGFRNNRLLVIFTLLGFLFITFRYIFNVVNDIFSEIYIKYGIGIEHLFSISLLTDLIFLIIVTLSYCYFEVYNFGNYSYILKMKYNKRADNWYRIVLDSVSICVLNSFFFLLCFFILKSLLLFIILIIIIIILLILLIMLVFKGTTNNLVIYICKKLYPFWKILSAWFALYMFVASITIPVMVGGYLNANLEVKYSIPDKNNIKLSFIFNDITSDKLPKDFNLSIVNSQGEKKITLKSIDFVSTGRTIPIRAKDKETQWEKFLELFSDTKIDLKSLNYKAKSNLDISPYIQNGNNDISIYFDIDNPFLEGKDTKNYNIIENIKVEGNKININQKRIIIKL